MKILAIECTHGFVSVAVSSGDRVVEHRLAEWQKTAELLVPLVIKVMGEAGLPLTEIDGIAVSSGPGSFTALRIGMSVAKGIAFGAKLPLVPVPTLLAMAEAVMAHNEAVRIVPVIPSRAGEYFYAIYERDGGVLSEIESSRCMGSELAGRISPLSGGMVIAGRSVGELADQVPALAPYVIETAFFSAASLFRYAGIAVSDGSFGTAAGTVPDYRQTFVTGRKPS